MHPPKRLILASASPRRRDILAQAGLSAEIFTGAGDTPIECPPVDPGEFVRVMAEQKSRDACRALHNPPDAIVLTADTVVYGGGRILGKPHDEGEAHAMLRLLSGTSHQVLTGVVLRDCGTGAVRSFAEVTDVYFRPLTDEEILSYIRRERPFDKAGAYGIQEGACLFVERIEGDYLNVVGLPVCRVVKQLRTLVP